MMKYLLVSCIGLLLFSCKTAQQTGTTVKSEVYPKIVFGYGGGFTGKKTQYCITQNGTLSRIAGSDTVEIKRLDEETRSSCFEKVISLNLASVKIDEPGNMYYFIHFYKTENDLVKATWGNPDYKTPEKVLKSYDLLSSTTK